MDKAGRKPLQAPQIQHPGGCGELSKTDMRRSKTYGVAWVVVVVIPVLVAVLAEASYRFVKQRALSLPSTQWVTDPILLYKLNNEDAKFPQSFRGKSPSPVKGSALRIICLGGSSTYGQGVGYEESWPAVLEQRLGELGVPADVVNAGVPGYGSRQLLLRYRRDIATLKPDFVILYSGWNRTGALVDHDEWVPTGIPLPEDMLLSRAGIFLSRHSLLLQDFIYQIVFIQQKASPLKWSMDPHHDVFVNDLTTLVKEIRAHGQTPVLIIYPALYHADMTLEERSTYEPMLWKGKSYHPDMLAELGRKQSAIRRVSEGTGSHWIDLQRGFGVLRGKDRARLFLDEMHLSALGNQKVGEAIATNLADMIRSGRGPNQSSQM